MGGATGGCGGRCPPLLGPAVYRGRSNENDLCFYSRQSLFSVEMCTGCVGGDWSGTSVEMCWTGRSGVEWGVGTCVEI